MEWQMRLLARWALGPPNLVNHKSNKNAPINYAEVMRRKLAKDNEDQMTAFETTFENLYLEPKQTRRKEGFRSEKLKSMRATL